MERKTGAYRCCIAMSVMGRSSAHSYRIGRGAESAFEMLLLWLAEREHGCGTEPTTRCAPGGLVNGMAMMPEVSFTAITLRFPYCNTVINSRFLKHRAYMQRVRPKHNRRSGTLIESASEMEKKSSGRRFFG